MTSKSISDERTPKEIAEDFIVFAKKNGVKPSDEEN